MKATRLLMTLVALALTAFHFLPTGMTMPGFAPLSTRHTPAAATTPEYLYGTAEEPGHWVGCEPIHVALARTPQTPQGASLLVRQVVKELASATGLPLVFDGETDQALTAKHLDTSDRAGKGAHAAILVGWGVAGSGDVLTGAQDAGRTVTAASESSAGIEITAAVVAVTSSGSQLTDLGVLRHEMGHAVGLGHSSDEHDLMAPVQSSRTTFTSRDKAHLATVGHRCS